MNSGKAFFAPADGVCWVRADENLSDAPESITIHHLSLGTDPDGKPLRTGAFVRDGRHLIFTAGKGPAAKLCWIDASADKPEINSLAIDVGDGEAISTPVTMRPYHGGTTAVMFGQFKDSPEDDRMLVVDLDPDHDGRFDDARVRKSIDVGPNQMVGHSGYHAIQMLPDHRHAVLSNPGDGTLWITDLDDFEIVARLKVKGTPTRILTVPQ